MTEHVRKCEHKNIDVLIFGFRCEDCGDIWDIASAIVAIQATSRLSVEDARYYHDLLNVEDSPLQAYADIREGK